MDNPDEQSEQQNDQFSIISYWKYDENQRRIFLCQHSFMTPKILPMRYTSNKDHKKEYLFRSRDEVFFFCKDQPDPEDEI